MFLLDWIISFFSCRVDDVKRNDSPQRSLRSDRRSYTRRSSGESNGGSRKSRRSRGSSKRSRTRSRRSNSFDQGLGYSRYDEFQQPQSALLGSDYDELIIGHQNNMNRVRDDLNEYEEENFVPIHSSASLSKSQCYSNEELMRPRRALAEKDVVIADNFASYSKNQQKVSTNFNDIPKLVLVPFGSNGNHGRMTMLGRYQSILSDKSVAPPHSNSFDNLEEEWDLQNQIAQSSDDVIPSSQSPNFLIDDREFDESLWPGRRNRFDSNLRTQYKESRKGRRTRQHFMPSFTNRSTVNRSKANGIPTKSRVFHPDKQLTIISATSHSKSNHNKHHDSEKSGMRTSMPQKSAMERSNKGLSNYLFKQSLESDVKNVAISPLSSEDVDPFFHSKNSGESFPHKVVRFRNPETHEEHARKLYCV